MRAPLFARDKLSEKGALMANRSGVRGKLTVYGRFGGLSSRGIREGGAQQGPVATPRHG